MRTQVAESLLELAPQLIQVELFGYERRHRAIIPSERLLPTPDFCLRRATEDCNAMYEGTFTSRLRRRTRSPAKVVYDNFEWRSDGFGNVEAVLNRLGPADGS